MDCRSRFSPDDRDVVDFGYHNARTMIVLANTFGRKPKLVYIVVNSTIHERSQLTSVFMNVYIIVGPRPRVVNNEYDTGLQAHHASPTAPEIAPGRRSGCT